MKNIIKFPNPWRWEIILGLAAFVILFGLLPFIPIFDGDTFYYISKAKRMLGTGDIFNTSTLMAKPILVLWVMSLFYKALAVSLLSTYLWHSLFAIGILISTYLFIKQTVGRRAAQLSTGVLLTSLMFFYQSCSPMLDIPMVFFLVISHWTLYKYITAKQPKYLYLTAIFCGLNFLTKGLMGAVIPAISFLIYLISNKINPLKNYSKFTPTVLISLIIFILICSIWILPQIKVHGQTFVKMLYSENIERFFHPIDETGGYRKVSSSTQRDPHLNIIYLILSFLPWSVFIIPAVIGAYKNNYYQQKPLVSFLLGWFYFILLVTTVSGHYKGPRYLLPLIPALAMLTGIYLDNLFSQNNPPFYKTIYRSFAGLFWFLALITLYLAFNNFTHGENEFKPFVVPFFGLLTTIMLIGYLFWRQKNYLKCINYIIILTILAYTLFLAQGIYYLPKLLPEYQTAKYIKQNLAIENNLYIWKIKIHSQDFYLNTNPNYISEESELANIKKGSIVITNSDQLETIQQHFKKATVLNEYKEWVVLKI